MDLIEWDDSYCTGHTMVDLQHQELFRMVNDLHKAIVAGRGRQVLRPTLDKLVNYTVEHFSAEERLMRGVEYPGSSAHKSKHVDLTAKVNELVTKYSRGQLVLSITLSSFLADWLRHHIQEDDMAMIRFVQASRASSVKAAAR